MLSSAGMGHNGRGENKYPGAEFARCREALAKELDEFNAAVKWCAANMSPRRSIVRKARHSVTSYGQKHIMEADCGTYVMNGTYIAAMLALGFQATDDYNPCFNAKLTKEAQQRANKRYGL